ncbi:RNA-binding motif protein, X-linked 2 isoform X1 [Drosophila elegans]|uniref:RNA-binding motif protein, X-linked 2 isoform X1 n=1 Tax=Drosophila elegans TaxID=30023 RepID=UPI0007E80239|nr:RNA-binding motif protein, X-linked 2 isoform X1 [Drosophila elegans]
MSQSDNAAREQTAANPVPEACQGCRGQLPRATPVEVEDMATPSLEKLIRKANMAQKMLNDVMKQIQKQQQESQVSAKEPKSKHLTSDGGKRRHRGRKHGHHSSSSSSSSSGHSDCELILAEKEEIMPRRRHVREDRRRDRSRSRGRSRGHSRGRSHGRSRSRSYTDSRRSRALPLALPVRISV